MESLYIFWLLHQTTTSNVRKKASCSLYIFWLLHQTTTTPRWSIDVRSCISFDSYIKPQQLRRAALRFGVVYLLTPTSNHNYEGYQTQDQFVVYLLTPTSNHNKNLVISSVAAVVYLLTPTSNHNLTLEDILRTSVVYLLTPTSNHNSPGYNIICFSLYIFWLLHQTTTDTSFSPSYIRCISFDSYIKPQR